MDKPVRPWKRYAAIGCAVFGLLLALNALVSGPHAFADKERAVLALGVAGIALIGIGVWQFARK
jgi:hypothetical protein